MELVYFASLLFACVIALGNWRAGLLLCILFDVVRDPIRKLHETQSVFITASASLLWIAVFLGCSTRNGREMWSAFRHYRKLKPAIQLLIAAILPGALLSLVLYKSGYILAAIGSASYLGPLLGLAVGWTHPRHEKDVYRIMVAYVIINTIAMSGTYMEWRGMDIPGLGGLKDFEWVRYDENRTIKLIAGFYRSPDIMGLHAAHVIIFSLVLAMRDRGIAKLSWGGMLLSAAFCVLISGRRKMIGMPLVFVAAFLLLSMIRGSRAATRAMIGVVMSMSLAAVILMAFDESSTTDDYERYASSIFTQGVERYSGTLGSVVVTLNQSGILGSGLGSATQGAYYAGIKVQKNWQEDGVSRLFKEMGVPGVLLLLGSAACMLSVFRQAIGLIPSRESCQRLQFFAMAIVAANLASFISSHQQYSGDPMSGLLVLYFAGAALGIPRIYFARRHRQRQPRPMSAPPPAELIL